VFVAKARKVEHAKHSIQIRINASRYPAALRITGYRDDEFKHYEFRSELPWALKVFIAKARKGEGAKKALEGTMDVYQSHDHQNQEMK
jgi:hypothetical protein